MHKEGNNSKTTI